MIIAMLSHCLTMFDRKEQKQKWNQIACFIIFIITEGCWAPAKYCELQRGKQAVVVISVSAITFIHVLWACFQLLILLWKSNMLQIFPFIFNLFCQNISVITQ